ncbi:hypothetical protein BH10ACI1_BH10ACI1_31800 [soil metagenome]
MNSKTDEKRIFLSLIGVAVLLFAFSSCGKSSKQKIVGKCSMGNSKEISVNFTEEGEMIMAISGKPDKKEKYRFIDDEKLEMESEKGEKVILNANFTDGDNTMTTTSEKGVKTIFKRQ